MSTNNQQQDAPEVTDPTRGLGSGFRTGFAPFDKESDDRLFVLSQLVGFVQLFVALLLVTGALGPDYARGGSGMKLRPSLPPAGALGPDYASGGLGGLMVGCNAVVAVASAFDAGVEDFAEVNGACSLSLSLALGDGS